MKKGSFEQITQEAKAKCPLEKNEILYPSDLLEKRSSIVVRINSICFVHFGQIEHPAQSIDFNILRGVNDSRLDIEVADVYNLRCSDDQMSSTRKNRLRHQCRVPLVDKYML